MINPIFSGAQKVYPRFSLTPVAGSLDPSVSFSRLGATATKTNSAGVLGTVAQNVARIDYDPLTLSCLGLLIEEAKTNLVRQSQAATLSPWTFDASAGSGFSLTGGLARDNTTQFSVFNEGTGTSSHRANQSFSVSASATVSFSIDLKAGTSRYIIFGSNRGGITIDTQNWVITQTIQPANTTVSAVRLIQVKSDTYRAFVSVSHTTDTTVFIVIGTTTSATPGTMAPSFAGTSRTAVFTFAQAEIGPPTSYIPTTTTTVLRNADVATITGSNFSGWWEAGRGSALVRARPSTVSGTRPLVQFDDATANNIIAMRGNTTNPELYIKSSGSDQSQIDAGTITANTQYRLAGAWATNDCAASINGGAAVIDGVATIPVVTQARLGSDGTNYLNGYLEAIEYYSNRKLNASLQVASSTAGYPSIINPVFADTIIF